MSRFPLVRTVAVVLCASLLAGTAHAGAAPARAVLASGRGSTPALPSLAAPSLGLTPSLSAGIVSLSPSLSVLPAPHLAVSGAVLTPSAALPPASAAVADSPSFKAAVPFRPASFVPPAASPAAQTVEPASPLDALQRTAALSAPQDAPRSPDAPKAALDAAFDAAPRRADAASPVAGAWSGLKRWTRAAALGTALALSLGGPALAQTERPAPPAPLAQLFAQAAAPRAAQPAAAPGVTVTARPQAESFTLADPIRVEVLVRNDGTQAVVVPADELLAGLRRESRGLFTVSLPGHHGGGVLVQPGTTVKVLVELETVGLPQGLERGKSIPIRFGAVSAASETGALTVPGFAFELASAHDAEDPPQGLYAASPWSERYYWDWLIAGLWALTGGAAYGLWRLYKEWKRRRALSLPVPPAAPDPGEVARQALDELEAALKAGLDAEEAYRRLIIVVNYFVGRVYGLDADPSADLSSAARTLRVLLAKVTRPKAPAAKPVPAKESVSAKRRRLVEETLAADRELIARSLRHWQRVLEPFDRAAASGNASARKRADGMRRRMGRHLAGLEERHKRLRAELDALIEKERPGLEKTLARRLEELEKAAEAYGEKLEKPREDPLPGAAQADLKALADSASVVLYAGAEGASPAADLARARRLVDALAPRKELPASLGAAAGLTLLGVTFGSPLWLLSLVPVALLLGIKAWRGRKGPPAVAAPSSALLKGTSAGRKALGWVPRALQVAALVVAVGGLADPQWGFKRGQSVVTSLDNVLVVDRSGSMYEYMPGSSGSKFQAAAEAARQFVNKQRGTTNRAGLILFSDDARLVMSLTLDYDALLAGFGQSTDGGGTNIPAGVDAAIQHFVEMSIVDLDARGVPGAAAVKEALKTRGLKAALAEARQHPQVLSAMTSPDRHKAVIFLSDGVGGDPAESVRRARDLGIHIFAIGVPGGADQATLEMMARETGGKFFWVNDKGALDAAFAEIDRLEKSWVNVTSPPRPVHHDHRFAYAALLLLMLSLAVQAGPLKLGRIPSRGAFSVLPLTVLLTLGQLGQAPNIDLNRLMNPPAQEQTEPRRSPLDLLPYREVPQLRDGVRLLEQDQPAKALEKLDEAAGAHPGYPEVDLFRSMALRRMKQPEAAERALERAVTQAQAQGRADVIAAAQLELGNAAASRGDHAAALRHYRNVLRVPEAESGSERARQRALREAARDNYETLLRQPPSRGGEGQQGQGQPQNGQGQPQQGQPQEGQGQPQSGQGQPQSGQGQPQSGQGQPQEGQGQPQSGAGQSRGNGQSQAKPGDKPGQEQGAQADGQGQKPGQPQPGGDQAGRSQNGAGQGQGKPQPGQGQGAAERALGEIERGQGAGQGRGERGRLYGLAPLAFLGLGELGASGLVWHHADILLWTAAAALALGFLLYRRLRGHHRAVASVAPGHTPRSLLSWLPGRAYLRKTVLALAAAAMLAAGASAPSVGTKEEQFSLGGKDVVVLQDVSLSVLWAEDGRYLESTRGLEAFLRWLENGAATDRVAVVPFAGAAGEAVLSDDYRNALFQLYHLGQDALYLPEGSDIGQGLYGAIRTFSDARDIGERQRILIVVSDGGDRPSAYLEEGLRLAKERGVTIYAISVGKDAGARLRVPPEDRARLGEYVAGAVAGIDRSVMRRLAAETGGLHLDADGEQSMEQVLARIAAHSKERSAGQANVENSVARVFLGPAALLLLLALLAGDGTGGRRPKTPAKKKEDAGGATLSGVAALPLAFGLPALLGPAAGLWPALAAGGAVALLLLAALWLSWRPKPAAPAAADPAARRAEVERAASGLHWDKLLRGEFRSPEAVRFGADPDDAVPHTDEPWRQVDHRASARTGTLHAKRFEEDPDIPFMLVIDVSRSGLQGSTGMTKRDVAADVAAAMAIAGAREDMNVGAILFSDRVEKVIPPRRGLAHARRLYASLRDYEPEGRDTAIASGLREALARVSKRGIVAVLSDFDGGDYQSALAAAGRRHVLVPVVLEDALEAALPKGVGGVEVEDPETGERGVLGGGSGAREEVAGALRERRRRLNSALGGASARPLYVRNDGAHLNRLVAYFRNGGRLDEPK